MVGPPLGVRSVSESRTRTLLEGQAEFFGGALRQHGAQALPHVGRRGADFNRAVLEGFDLGVGAIRRAAAQAGVLVGAGDAPGIGEIALAPRPAEIAVQSAAHVALAQVERVEQADAFAQKLPGRGRHADFLGVDAAELDRVDAEFFGDHIHVLLDGEGALGHAEAAKRARRRIVGVHGEAVDFGVGDVVGPGRVGGGAGHDFIAQAGIGAAVAVEFGFDRRQLAVARRAGLDADDGRVALGVEQQRFLARVEHLDRAIA